MMPRAPSWHRELTSFGVTGTNGKTTTTKLLAAALTRHCAPVASITTVGNFLDDARLPVALDRDGFLETMRSARERGGRYAVAELTSEALAFGYAKFWPCRYGVFTNLTRDHLDAHGSAEHYLASKAQLFMHLRGGGGAVLNGCDRASELLAEVIPEGVRVVRYGIASRGQAGAPLDVEAREAKIGWSGTSAQIVGPHATIATLATRAIGEVFVENALAAWIAATIEGVPGEVAAHAIAEAPPPPGRFEVVAADPHVVIDYAHTPDALARTLATARALCRGSLAIVFGAGGNRDRQKRPQMGEAAGVADAVVLTSDNPRNEDPAAIAAQIREGIGVGTVARVELDRRAAIESTILSAGDHDVIVIAGKGHESTQTIGTSVMPFSDADEARRAHALRS
jgi:UDP-N-acetylmuramoyl-L-alanyl-D-glutamate--2,6-diaminopimelate ligase